ncbi:MAG TPA: ABC transporter ATP-binding protein [Anaerolineaceae bacterium]|jgi:ABC-type lipoprotein export system ATPase subunit|nr:ABC transporter ATP-binding protein [Anaerolineaceae bacterium]NMD32110.1 ABC transporter ATP-binding protein [Chloroflexota bacterium]HNS63650.1 ABC transporter ATP-binding protein [Anaerolineaceae bacterium]HNZ00829.1 ABC transporter ATP-binding protein [Anaerolineaceae bacterium]HOD43509.1 ABC transporter ATP-binding protein [Anaerolineaceae bacterium]
MNILVQTKNLTKIYASEKPVAAVQQVNLSIYTGEFIALLGPSGSGKTTLLNLIGALDVPTEGEILYKGNSLSKFSENELATFRRNEIGFIFQLFHLFPALTALENVIMPLLPVKGRLEFDVEERARDLLATVGLKDRFNHFPAQLSGGECQRVAIARALINTPTLLLADEPTGNLDTQNGAEILALFDFLNQQLKQTILMITHDAKIARKAQRHLYIEDGRIL